MRKSGVILILIIFSFTNLLAQRYRDIYPQIISTDEENAFEILNSYLNVENDHPNANLRIAQIYINRYKSVDVLREYEKALALAEQAKYKLIKSKVTVDDKEVRKNSEYYIGMLSNGQFSYEAISAYIDAESAAVNEFIQKLPPIYKEFTQSVEKYDEAVKSFSNIVGSHTSLKELYLLYDANLKNQLLKLSDDYDSTKYYFDSYLNLRNQYKVNAVDQNFIEKPIKVYRLDGMVTQINFLQPNIELWDYASWVDSVNVIVDQNIASLRKSLVTNEARLREAINTVNNIENPDSFRVVRVEKELVFNLMKYDYKNALVPLLNYQEFKQQLIKEQKRKIYFDTASLSTERKLTYYSNMMFAAKEADSIIHDFEMKFDIEQLKRHDLFIQESFGGAEQMKKYMGDQKEENKQLFETQVASIKEGILSIARNDSLGPEVKYRRTVIPQVIVAESVLELPENYVKTKFLLKSADENLYVAGEQVSDPKNANIEVAIAKLSPNNTPVWFQSIDIEIDSAGVDANHFLGDIKLTPEGMAMIIRSIGLDSSKVVNTLIYLNNDGEIKFGKRLATELFPRELIYLEASNMFIMTFFGESETMNPSDQGTLSVRAMNGLGEELWHYENIFSGDYRKMLTVQNGLLIGGNYSSIKAENGMTKSIANGTNAYIISLTLTGALNEIACYSSSESYAIDTFYKVSDRNINLLGTMNEHLIIDEALQTVYSTISLQPN